MLTPSKGSPSFKNQWTILENLLIQEPGKEPRKALILTWGHGNAMQCFASPRHAMPCCAVLYCAVLCCAFHDYNTSNNFDMLLWLCFAMMWYILACCLYYILIENRWIPRLGCPGSLWASKSFTCLLHFWLKINEFLAWAVLGASRLQNPLLFY